MLEDGLGGERIGSASRGAVASGGCLQIPTCLHDVLFGGLCVECGCVVKRTGATERKSDLSVCQGSAAVLSHKLRHRAPGFLTTSPDLYISAAALAQIEEAEHVLRQSRRRLVLVLDIDHTLLVARPSARLSASLPRDSPTQVGCTSFPSSSYLGPRITADGQNFEVRLRPYLYEFLREALELAELYLYTHGTGLYAQAIVNLIDPEGVFFGSPPRLFHRDNTPKGLKSLQGIFPGDISQVVVVDDRDDVWGPEVRQEHLLKVLPYIVFPGDPRANVSLEGYIADSLPRAHSSVGEAPANQGGKRRKRMDAAEALADDAAGMKIVVQTEEDPDAQLLFVTRVLRKLHEATFNTTSPSSSSPPSRALRSNSMLHALRRQTLRGCVVCVTGFQKAAGLESSRQPIVWWCVHLGANVSEVMKPGVTHLVATRSDTEKYHEAICLQQTCGASIHVVHPAWVLWSAATWRKADETAFSLLASGQLGDASLPSFFRAIWKAGGASGGPALPPSPPPVVPFEALSERQLMSKSAGVTPSTSGASAHSSDSKDTSKDVESEFEDDYLDGY